MKELQKAYKKIHHLITHDSFKEKFRSTPLNFIRKRRFSFASVMISILDLAKKSLQINLNELCIDLNLKKMTKQAFSLARQKIDWAAFKSLNEEIVYDFYANKSLNLFNNYLIFAIDGSTFILPNAKEVVDYFGKVKNQSCEKAIGKFSILYDVLNKIILDTRIAPYSSSEKNMAIEHLEWLVEFKKKVNKKIILLFDRGYSCNALFILLKKLGIDFICRGYPKRNGSLIEQLEGQSDKIVKIKVDSRMKKKAANTWFRMFANVEINDCEIRMIKSRTSLYLITSLSHKIKKNKIDKLYFKRWGVETKYFSIKVDMLLENFSGKKLIVIFQEIYATIIMQNLAGILEYDLCRDKSKTFTRKFSPNHRETLGVVKMLLKYNVNDIFNNLAKILENIYIHWIPMLPGRKYKRKLTGCRLKNRSRRLCYA